MKNTIVPPGIVQLRERLERRFAVTMPNPTLRQSRERALESILLEEIIKGILPGLEKEYEFWNRGFVLPTGEPYDSALDAALAIVRASRAPGQRDTRPEDYVARVQPIQKPSAEPEPDQPPVVASRPEKRRAARRSLAKKLWNAIRPKAVR
jgi:hypothetical protein